MEFSRSWGGYSEWHGVKSDFDEISFVPTRILTDPYSYDP